MKRKNLVIVESPSKAKTIQKYLGEGYQVMASGGHVCDLPEKTLGIDVEHNFKPEYVINSDKKELIKKLKQGVKEAQTVYLATDPDREGEAISWHLANVLGVDGESRIEFNEISQRAVKAALTHPRAINRQLVDAQQARRVLDRLVGYRVSPILSRKIKVGLSGGRVQSAALKMVVDREREIRAFKPEEYWTITAFLKKYTNSSLIKAVLADLNGKKIKPSAKEEADKILADLEDAEWVVDTVKRGQSKSRPQAPFTTSTLQQDGSQKLNLTSPQVMQIAQQLYEGVELPGEGHTAFVTYIRTDSVRISSDMQKTALDFIRAHYGEEYAPPRPNVYTTKSKNVQDAHEAIRPISLELTPESVKDKLPRNHYRLYKLIYERFIASQMTDAVYDTLSVRISARNGKEDYGFKVNGRAVSFKGYTVVYETERGEEEEGFSADMPNLEEGERLLKKEIKAEQKFTKPAPRYTDATLVKAMEENGIGRPSTYASVIGVLQRREYTIKEQKAIRPTELGETVTRFMEDFFSDIVDLSFTANMENRLDEIEHGLEWQSVIRDFYPKFSEDLNKANANDIKMPLKEVVSDVVCEKCGVKMVVKEGRYGKFLACPNYPRCRNVKNIVEPVGTCPACGAAITKRRTKTGKIFYGCSNYPNCKFMSWELPAPIFCPKCHSAMRIQANGGKKVYVCTSRACATVVDAQDGPKEDDLD